METIAAHIRAYEQFPDAPQAYRTAAWDGTFRQLFKAAVAHVEDRILDYDNKAAQRAKVAKRIRFWSLLLFALGTLAPILLTFLTKAAAVAGVGGTAKDKWTWIDWTAAVPFAEVGYVLLATAGALVIFDQFFDASGSWIRFRQSQARLEVLLAEFRFDWAVLMTKSGGTYSNSTEAVEPVTLLRTFVSKVELLAEEETKEWAQRFNSRIAAFDSNPNLKIRLDATIRPDGTTTDATDGEGFLGSARNGAEMNSAAANNGRKASSPMTVKVRLAIADTENLEQGSLKLFVNEAPVNIPEDGLIELPLEVGHAHHLAAIGRRNGQVVRAEIPFTPSINDDGKPMSLRLS
jgi:hypothetical protein